MKKKVIKAALSVIMASMIALTGCSGSGSSNTEGSADSGNSKITQIYIYQNSGVLDTGRPEGSDPDKLKEMQQMYVEKLGIEPIAIVPPKGSETEKLNILLSSKDRLDVFYGKWDDYASKGAIRPINDLLDQYGQDVKKAWPENAWAKMTDKDGKIWGIPRTTPTVAHPVWLRMDWMEKLNLTMPTNLDELETILKMFKENDPDGNGKADTIPMMTNLSGLRNGFLGGFTEFGNSNWIDPADNKLKPVELAPGFKDFVTKMADWYQKGYIYKEAFGKWTPLDLLKTNRVGSSSAWYSWIALQVPRAKEVDPNMNYVLAKDIKGPKGLIQTVAQAGTNGLLFTKKSKNPEEAMKFINDQYKDVPSNTITAKFGLDWEFTDSNKFEFVNRDQKFSYAGEFYLSAGLPTETKYAAKDPMQEMMSNHLRTELEQLSTAKMPIDALLVYDQSALLDKIPNLGDLNRLKDEELTKFIMGARPLNEFDKFIDELYQAGLNNWIEEMTRQYNELTK